MFRRFVLLSKLDDEPRIYTTGHETIIKRQFHFDPKDSKKSERSLSSGRSGRRCNEVYQISASRVVSPPYTIYMGVDKYENEDLIKYGFPEDIWFHVDKLSSAHVYLRLRKGQSIDDIPSAVLEDCAQLVKANSIQGCKMNNVSIVYTPWANLKKTGDMAVGQVGFHKNKEVKTIKVEKKINEIINRLNKTKEEKTVDLKEEREERDKAERADQRKVQQEQKRKEKEEMKKRQEQAELRSYSSLMNPENMQSNTDYNSDASDDFM